MNVRKTHEGRCEACGAVGKRLVRCPDCQRSLCRSHVTGKIEIDDETTKIVCKPCELDDKAGDELAHAAGERAVKRYEALRARGVPKLVAMNRAAGLR